MHPRLGYLVANEACMAIPTFSDLIPPVLQVLSDYPDGVVVATVYAKVADAVKLTPEEMEQRVPSQGQAVYKNRIGWAPDSLKRVGWSSSPRHGLWRITPAGVEALKAHAHGFTPEELKVIGRANATI